MKGLIFTEFLEMVELRYSNDMVDDMIALAQPASGGAYTAVGEYEHQELVALSAALAELTQQQTNEIVKQFGEYVFDALLGRYQRLFEDKPDALTFLYHVDRDIHSEMRKLYPDIMLPQIDCHYEGEWLIMDYSSARHFEDLVEGLIRGCGRHFGETLVIERESLENGVERFRVKQAVV